MKKIRRSIKRALLNMLPKDIISFTDNNKETELHCYKFLGTYIKIRQIIKPIQPNDEQSEYLGILRPAYRS